MQGLIYANEQYFNPRQLPGLVLWLDATDPSANGVLPSNGISLATWVDKSTKGNNATQGTGANQPAFTSIALNGKPGLASTLSTVMSMGTTGFPTGAGTRTLFLVVKDTNVNTDIAAFQYGINNVLRNFYQCGIFLTQLFCLPGGGYVTGNSILSNNTPYILEYNYNGGNMSTMTAVVNGTAQTMTQNFIDGVLNTTTDSPVIFNTSVDGYLFEIIFCSTSLSAANQSLCRNYLINKWFSGPPQVSGLVLWLDGNDPNATGVQPSNGTSVSTWKDKSIQANDATQGTGANQPVFNTNLFGSNGGLTFSSSTKGINYTLNGFGSGSSAFTTFQVVRFDSGSLSSGGYVTGFGTNAPSQYYSILSNGGGTPKMTVDANGNQSGNTTLTGNTNYIWEENYTAASDMSTIALTLNGVAQTNSGSSGGAINVVKTSGFVGSLFGIGFGLVGEVAEIIVFNKSLTATEESLITRYLSSKWGIPI